MRKTLGLVLGLVIAILAAGEARAQLRVCNESSEPRVDIAIAYEEGGDWISTGWYVVQQGGCQTILRAALTSRFYYVFAKGEESSWDGEDGNAREFCVIEDRAFTLQRRQAVNAQGALQCEAHGYRVRTFHQIDVGDSTLFTHTLED